MRCFFNIITENPTTIIKWVVVLLHLFGFPSAPLEQPKNTCFASLLSTKPSHSFELFLCLQGAEKEVIILATTTTTTRSEFCSDGARLNVALTRARRHLLVVGAASVLSQVSACQ